MYVVRMGVLCRYTYVYANIDQWAVITQHSNICLCKQGDLVPMPVTHKCEGKHHYYIGTINSDAPRAYPSSWKAQLIRRIHWDKQVRI